MFPNGPFYLQACGPSGEHLVHDRALVAKPTKTKAGKSAVVLSRADGYSPGDMRMLAANRVQFGGLSGCCPFEVIPASRGGGRFQLRSADKGYVVTWKGINAGEYQEAPPNPSHDVIDEWAAIPVGQRQEQAPPQPAATSVAVRGTGGGGGGAEKLQPPLPQGQQPTTPPPSNEEIRRILAAQAPGTEPSEVKPAGSAGGAQHGNDSGGSGNSGSSGTNICVVCQDAAKNILFTPCGHVCCCKDCSALLKECPMCRKPITGRIVAFL